MTLPIPARTLLRGLSLAGLLLGGGRLPGQSAAAPVWGLYASYVGSPPLWADPCNITYTIAVMDNPQIVANVASGLMIAILEGVPRGVAQNGLKAHGRYFDDRPDGIVKLKPCGSGGAADAPPPGSPLGGGAGGCGEVSSQDRAILVAEPVAGTGDGRDPYQSASVRTCIDPARTLWIAWNDRPDASPLAASRPGQPLLGPGGGGTDDFIEATVLDPAGRSRTVRMDQNDGFGASFGPQNVLFGRREDAPDVYRKTPFGPAAGREAILDEEGAFNGFFTQAGEYTFRFDFRDNSAGRGGFGHPRVYLIVKAGNGAAPSVEAIRPRHGSQYRIRYRGQVWVTLYERGSDQGVPMDLFYWRQTAADGSPQVQDGQPLWRRVVRKPASDHPGASVADWFEVHWIRQGDRWVEEVSRGVPFDVLEEVH